MKGVYKKRVMLIWVGLVIGMQPILGQTVEEEILVLFRADVIQLPIGKISVTLDEIQTPTEVMNTLQALNVIEVTKGFPKFEPQDTIRIAPDGTVARLPDFSNLFLLRLPTGKDRDSAIIQLEALSQVIYAEKNQRGYPEYVPNDPWRIHQWYLGSGFINAYGAFDLSHGSSTTKIGILDTGVDRDHEDLSGKVAGDVGYHSPHGTKVAGVAAAKTDNYVGMVGIDWHAQIWSENLLGWTTPILSQAVIDAVNAGCQIINNSWGLDGYSPTLHSAFSYAYQMGALPVSSMSNTDNPNDYPKKFGFWMLNVGATNIYDRKADISVTGYWIDVGAPGENIYTTLPGNNYGFATGTSLAAPVVSGIAGLLLGANPSLKNYDLEWIIKLSADDIEAIGWDEKTGYGRVNAYEAVKKALPPYEITRGTASTSLIWSGRVVFLNAPLPEKWVSGAYLCDIYKVEKTISGSWKEPPWGWFSLTGFSGASSNLGWEWLKRDASTSSITIKTFFFYLKRQLATGRTVNEWAPVDPNMIPLQYTILGEPYQFGIVSGPTVDAEPNGRRYENRSYPAYVTAVGSGLTYTWTVDGRWRESPMHQWQAGYAGNISGLGASVSYRAPDLPGGAGVLLAPARQYENRVTVTVRDAYNQAETRRTEWFRISKGDTPSCPFLYTWDGSGFVEDNNILWPSVEDITDHYKIHQPLVLDDNTYNIQIREMGYEHSWFDRLELITVDRPKNLEIGVTVEGEIFGYEEIFRPLSCIDQNGVDHLDKILGEDDLFLDVSIEDTLIIAFFGEPFSNNIAVGLTNVLREPIKIPPGIMAASLTGNTVYLYPDIYTRENHSTAWATALFETEPDTVIIILTQKGERSLDEVYLTNVITAGLDIQSAPLRYAFHSIREDVRDELLTTDSVYAELWTGEQIELRFDSPGPPTGTRDFVFLSRGRYTTEPAPMTIIENTITELEELKAGLGEDAIEEIDDAISYLTESLNPDWWIDERHLSLEDGEDVFDLHKDAVEEITEELVEELIDEHEWTPEQIEALLGWVEANIVKADKLLALTLFAEVQGMGIEEEELEEIIEYIRDAYGYVEDGELVSASEAFGEVWEEASDLLMELVDGGGAQTAGGIPKVFSLSQNYPNPARGRTVITYQLPIKSDVSLKIYDISGRLVRTLVDGKVEAGYYSARFDGRNLGAGIYFARLTAGQFSATRKIVLLQ